MPTQELKIKFLFFLKIGLIQLFKRSSKNICLVNSNSLIRYKASNIVHSKYLHSLITDQFSKIIEILFLTLGLAYGLK